MKYVFDTNILIHLLRNSTTWQFIERTYAPFDKKNQVFISFVTVAEVLSIARQLGWGQEKIKSLALLFQGIEIVTVSSNTNDLIVQGYVEIDSFSQGKNRTFLLPQGMSARNMGKNDIWIAATTYALDAKLITTDKDFSHLRQVFFDILFIDFN
jgi:tRNA(fMet)-specific endonuclease VapC